MKTALLLATIAVVIFSLSPTNVSARSGCCSKHKGVCGCGCCDGTPLSTTCAPYYPECAQPVYVAPVVTKAPVVYTPKPSTPKPTVFLPPTQTPTQTPTSIPTATPTIMPTNSPTSEPEVKSAATENTPTSTPTSTPQPPKTEANTKDALLGLGIFIAIVGGLIWIIRRIIRKIISIFRKNK